MPCHKGDFGSVLPKNHEAILIDQARQAPLAGIELASLGLGILGAAL
jgi:hypothetical protein